MAKATNKAIKPKTDLENLPVGLTEEDLDQPKAKAKVKQADYEAWKCEVRITKNSEGKTVREYEKLKCTRPVVKITDQEAETLNRGYLNGADGGVITMFFKPGGSNYEERQPKE
jgi:hypothetical protein